MAIELGLYGSRDVLNLQVFDYKTKAPLMTMDYANTSSQELTGTRVYAMGAGTRRIAWDGEKTATLKVETQVFTMQHLSMLAGESISSGANDIYKTEVLKVSGTDAAKTITLSRTPVGGIAEISVLPFVNGVSVSETSQKVKTVASKVVTLDTTASVKVGDEVEVFYRFSALSKKLSFTAKGFPKYVFLVGDTLFQDEFEGEASAVQFKYYKAKLQPNFTINSSSTGDPTSISLVFDLFPVKVNGVDTLIDTLIYEDADPN